MSPSPASRRFNLAVTPFAAALLFLTACSTVQPGGWRAKCLTLPPCPEEVVVLDAAAEDDQPEEALTQYAESMLESIKSSWEIPEIAKLGIKATVKVRFEIKPEGDLACFSILKESRSEPMADASAEAVCRAAPFNPLPEQRAEDSQDTQMVTLTFFYNVQPPGSTGMVMKPGKYYRVHSP